MIIRLGTIIPEKGIRSKTKLYQSFYSLTSPIHGLLKKHKHVTTTTKLGLAMIACIGNEKVNNLIYNSDINDLAKE